MAFEMFLTGDKAVPKKGRRITYTLSVGLHGALLVVGAIYSFWHVEELSPPNVTVTFLSGAPPPPPPPPPPKKKSSSTIKKPKTPVEIVQPKPDQIVQPKETPKEEPKEEEEEDGAEEGGVEGGVKGGVVGGVVGGTVGSSGPVTDAPKFLPPNVGEMQVMHKVDPQLPEAMKRAGMRVAVLVKVCVSIEGNVTSVTFLKKADPTVDASVDAAMKQRRYKPYSVNGRAVPFCHPVNITFNVTN